MNNDQPWVVIPTYNEKNNISKMIPLLFSLPVSNISVAIVDDGSPDGTGQTVKELQKTHKNLHLIERKKKNGLGRAYMAGFSYALSHGATSVVQMDADFSHDPNDVPKLIEGLSKADVVIGSRYIQGISVINWPLHRLLLSIAGNTYAKIITGLPVKDSTGGFKAWKSKALEAVDAPSLKANGYGFQIGTTYRAWKKGFKIKEIPIIFTERRDGQSKMNQSIIKEALLLVWKLRLFG